jgi:hypothetical protein
VFLSADVPLETLEIPGSVLVAEARTSADFPVKPIGLQGQPVVLAFVSARLGGSRVTSEVQVGPL